MSAWGLGIDLVQEALATSLHKHASLGQSTKNVATALDSGNFQSYGTPLSSLSIVYCDEKLSSSHAGGQGASVRR